MKPLPASCRIKVFCLCVSILFLHNKSFAQQKHAAGLWLGFSLRKPIGKKFSCNSDVQLRFRNNSAFYDYTLVRTALQFEANKHFNYSLGILYGTDNLHDKSLPVWRNEYRVYQEARIVTGDMKKLQLTQQFRLEQRWFDISNTANKKESLFALRYRYRIDFRKQLSGKWKLLSGNELMYQHSAGKTIFNQDRLYAGAGYNFNLTSELQVSLQQIIWKAPDQTVLRLSYLKQL